MLIGFESRPHHSMTIVRGHWSKLLQPGLAKAWAGTFPFTLIYPGKIWFIDDPDLTAQLLHDVPLAELRYDFNYWFERGGNG